MNVTNGAGLGVALGVPYSVVRKAIAEGLIVPTRVGRYDLFDADDLAAIRAKLVTAGLIEQPPVVQAAAALFGVPNVQATAMASAFAAAGDANAARAAELADVFRAGNEPTNTATKAE